MARGHCEVWFPEDNLINELNELIDLDNIEHSNCFLFPELKRKYKTLPIRILEEGKDEPAG